MQGLLWINQESCPLLVERVMRFRQFSNRSELRISLKAEMLPATCYNSTETILRIGISFYLRILLCNFLLSQLISDITHIMSQVVQILI